MSKKNDDFLFGIFDFDGNGKTTIDEEYIGYLILRDIVGANTDRKKSFASKARRLTKVSASASSDNVKKKENIEDVLSKEESKPKKKTGYIYAAVILTLIFVLISGFIIINVSEWQDENTEEQVHNFILDLMEQERYDAAANVLRYNGSPNYSDTRIIREILWAYNVMYKNGSVESAYDYLTYMDKSSATQRTLKELWHMRDVIRDDADADRQRRYDREYREWKQKQAQNTPTPVPTYKPYKKTSSEEDKYDVSRFKNAEDFYDYYYYDFFDYEDAESYYNRHK